MVLVAQGEAASLFPLAQDSPHPSSHEAIQQTKLRRDRVLEVVEPAAKHRIELLDDPLQADAPGSFRLGAHLVLERRQALFTHEPMTAFEAIAEEIEPLPRLSGVADPRLVRVQRQAVLNRPRRYQ